MKNVSILTIMIALLFSISLSAEWQKVDDLESGIDAWSQVINREGGTSQAVIEPDPLGSGSNVIAIYPGDTIEDTLNMRAYVPIPEIVSGTATFFVRFMQPNVTLDDGTVVRAQVDVVWGLSEVDEPGAYGDYSPLMRIEPNQTFDVYDGGPRPDDATKLVGYVDVKDQLMTDTWYSCWIVVNHDTREYNVWLQGGEYTEMTQVFPESGMVPYRNKTLEPLDRFLITTSAGNLTDGAKGLDPIYFDDLYIDLAGVNQGNPVDGGGSGGETWNGFPVVDGIAYTENFLGAINVLGDPWVFIFDLNVWAYVPEVADSGAWVWISK